MPLLAEARLKLSTRPALLDRLHGAWWPTSDDLVSELPLMLVTAAPSVPAVIAVSLNRSEWPGAPLLFRASATHSPTLSWYGLPEPHLAVLQCTGRRRLVLLLVPPDTSHRVAAAAMAMASSPGNVLSAHQTLERARLGRDDVLAPDGA